MFRFRSFSPEGRRKALSKRRGESHSRKRDHIDRYDSRRYRSRSPRERVYSERNRSRSSSKKKIDGFEGRRNRHNSNASPQMRFSTDPEFNSRYRGNEKSHYRRKDRTRSPSTDSSYSPRHSFSEYAASSASEGCTVPGCLDCPSRNFQVPREGSPRKKETNEKIALHIVNNLVGTQEGGKENKNGDANTKSTDNPQDAQARQSPESPVKKPLEEEVLNFLGDRISTERKYDDPVQEDFALRITDIVTLGLKNEESKSLTDTYCPPSNCRLIDPPKVNIEAMSKDATAKERDKRIAKTQLKNAASLAAAQKGLTILLNQNSSFEEIFSQVDNTSAIYTQLEKLKNERISMIDHFSKAARLSADIQHEHSMVRRGLLLGNMQYSESIKEAIKSESKIDEFLFGSKLAEIIKAAKTRESIQNKESRPRNNYSKNFRAPLRGNYHQPAPGSGSRHTMNTPVTSNKGNQSQHQSNNQPHRSNKYKNHRPRSRKY